MNQPARERLYSLVPSIYRVRDAAQGEPLRALLAVIEAELDILETDIDALYDNWFIETCDEWVVPYIADLLDVRELYAESTRTYGQVERRAFVANTLAYRRRKGTTPVLEQLVRDVTGWRARAVEFFERLATTPNLNSGRRVAATVSLRKNKRPELLGNKPFEQNVAYTPEVRRIATGRGRYNVPNIGLFVWRLQSYPLEQVRPGSICPSVKGVYSFNPLGLDAPLFNTPETETEITQLAEEIHVPGKLRHQSLRAELQKRRQDLAEGKAPDLSGDFGIDPVIKIFINGKSGKLQQIAPEHILIANLGTEKPKEPENIEPEVPQRLDNAWQLPAGERQFERNGQSYKVAVDPELGRLAFPPKALPRKVYVSYAYGFSGDIGGGPYDRSDSITSILNHPGAQLNWNVVSRSEAPHSLQTVLSAWNRIAQDWQSCYDRVSIPIARVKVNLANPDITLEDPQPSSDRQSFQRTDARIHPDFQLGILQGLTMQAEVGDRGVTLSPGIAINARGERLELPRSRSLNLSRYRDKTVALCLMHRPQRFGPDSILQVVTVLEESPDAVLLAKFQIDGGGKIARIDFANRKTFAPGILNVDPNKNPLMVEVDSQTKKITVQPLKAINAQGIQLDSPRTILPLESEHSLISKLKETYSLEPTINPTVTVTVFVRSPQNRQEKQAEVDFVPEGAGVIAIRDNRTYIGDWLVQIPAARSLHLLAASGYRPHLCGNGLVYALATNDTEPGAFTLDGLLIEGRLTTLGGYLSRLRISHTTLVPDRGGLVLSPYAPPRQDAKPQEKTSLTTWLSNWTENLRQMLNVGFSQDNPSPGSALAQFTQMVIQEMSCLVSTTQQEMRRWCRNGQSCLDPLETCFLPHPPCSTALIETLTFTRAICGPLWLGKGVNKVVIQDSLLDCGRSSDVGGAAIAAPYSRMEIATTTVLGTTTARSLEASNCLFNEKVVTLQRQSGCLRFCYVPDGSQTPPRYACQPDLTLTESLDCLPASISAIAARPSGDRILVGTASTDLFLNKIETPGDESVELPTDKQLEWQRIPEGQTLEDRNSRNKLKAITALLVAAFPDISSLSPDSENSEAPSEPPPQAGTSVLNYLAATAEGMLYRSTDHGDNWTQLNVGSTDTREVNLASLVKPTPGKITIKGVIVEGEGEPRFNTLQKGDWLTAWGQTRTIVGIDAKKIVLDSEFEPKGESPTEFAITPSSDFAPTNTFITTLVAHIQQGTGLLEISAVSNDPNQSQRSLVGVNNTKFLSELKRGDAITIWDQALGEQTRTVVDIKSDSELVVNLPFDMHPGCYPFVINNLFAGTAGAGVLRFTPDGNSWLPVNQGLANRLITAMVLDERGHLIVGSMGGGVFLSKDNGESWKPINRGLENHCVTDLHFVASQQLVLAGTSGSGLFASTDGGTHWVAINGQTEGKSLTNLNITAIASYARSTDENGTRNQKPEENNAPETPTLSIFVGTEGGGIFRSNDRGETWENVGLSFPNLDITTMLTVRSSNEKGGTLLAGTNSGNLLQTVENVTEQPTELLGARWVSVNQGLTNVDKKLQILNHLQPSFTSTIYGAPGYGQLGQDTAWEIYTGAEDGAELGTFNFLKQPQRQANLRASLDEYLRFGLEAGIFYET